MSNRSIIISGEDYTDYRLLEEEGTQIETCISGLPNNSYFIIPVPLDKEFRLLDISNLISKITLGENNIIIIINELYHVESLDSPTFGDRDYRSRQIANLKLVLHEEHDVNLNMISFDPVLDSFGDLMKNIIPLGLTEVDNMRLTYSLGNLYRTDTMGLYAVLKDNL